MHHFLLNKVLDLYLGISYAKQSEIEDHMEEHTNSASVCYHIIYVHLNSQVFRNFRKCP